MKSTPAKVAIIVSSLYLSANAQVSQTCPSTNVCYSLNIPDTTASSGQGDIYFQMTAPTTYEWVALGQGSRMAGSNMFIMYSSANGQNVTVSSRPGTGHVPPETAGATAVLTLLEGSGIANGSMTANVRCSSCSSWNGGSMDFSSSSGTWIYAARSGAPMISDDTSAQIRYHNEAHGGFDWDFSAARGGSSVNPFIATDQTTVTSASTQSTGSLASGTHMLIAHGVLASLAWVIFIPTGAIVIRMAPWANVVWVHAAIQAFGYITYIAAFGLGVYMANMADYFSHHHPIIGIVIFILASSQPISGLLHHLGFKKSQTRNGWSFVHLTFGRVALILGIVNGGLGLQWAANGSDGAIVAYGVVAGLFGVTWLAVMVFGEYRRHQKNRSDETRLSSQDTEK